MLKGFRRSRPAPQGLAACATSRLLEAVGFATVVAVLLDGPLLSLAWERSLGGLQPGFWEQPPHASGLADVVHFRVEPLLPL